MSTNTALDQLKNRVEGHTEGPWKLAGGGEYLSPWGIDIGSEDSSSCPTVRPADAELFIAAPKMLAALEAVDELAREAHLDLKQANEEHGIECHEKHSACLASLVLEAIEEALR